MLPRNLLLSAVFGSGVLAAPAMDSSLVQRGLDINKFVDAVLKFFPGSVNVNNACSLIGKAETFLGKAFNINQDSNSNGCTDVTIIFARGTCDPGNVGVLVGPPFFQAVQDAIGSKTLNVQGVAYPASIDGYLNADKGAGDTM